MERCIEVISTMSLQAAILVCSGWLFVSLYRKSSPNFRYNLWLIVLFYMLVPAGIFLPSNIYLPKKIETFISNKSAPPRIYVAIDGTQVSGVADISGRSFGEEKNSGAAPFFPNPKFSIVWMSVSILLFGSILVRTVFWSRRLKSCSNPEPALSALLEKYRLKMKIKRQVELFIGVGRWISGPVTTCLFHPKIILPRHMQDWDQAEVEAAIVHELAHIKRKDLLLNWLQIIIQVMYFFHPMVWYLNRKIRQEREMCCDDLSMLYLDGRRRSYGMAMIRALEIPRRIFPVAGASMARANDVERRISRMLNQKYSGYVPMGFSSILKLFCFFVLSLSLAAPIWAQSSLNEYRFDVTDIFGVETDMVVATPDKSEVLIPQKTGSDAKNGWNYSMFKNVFEKIDGVKKIDYLRDKNDRLWIHILCEEKSQKNVKDAIEAFRELRKKAYVISCLVTVVGKKTTELPSQINISPLDPKDFSTKSEGERVCFPKITVTNGQYGGITITKRYEYIKDYDYKDVDGKKKLVPVTGNVDDVLSLDICILENPIRKVLILKARLKIDEVNLTSFTMTIGTDLKTEKPTEFPFKVPQIHTLNWEGEIALPPVPAAVKVEGINFKEIKKEEVGDKRSPINLYLMVENMLEKEKK